ncbi:peroxidase [Mycoplasmatota bacterium]|nr:peroxidase [Mycoplasmatota bacterium]
MLDYAVKLTKNNKKITRIDIEILRNEGFNDKDNFDINQVVAYFNYVNRVVNGLGVELEKNI